MAGTPSDTNDDSGVGSGRESTTGTPRWVKAFAIIAVALVVLVVILLLIGGHGPGRHLHGGLGGRAAPGVVTAAGVHQQ